MCKLQHKAENPSLIMKQLDAMAASHSQQGLEDQSILMIFTISNTNFSIDRPGVISLPHTTPEALERSEYHETRMARPDLFLFGR